MHETKAETTAYLASLDQADERLKNVVVKHQQLHQLYPDAGHERSRTIAVQAKAATLE